MCPSEPLLIRSLCLDPPAHSTSSLLTRPPPVGPSGFYPNQASFVKPSLTPDPRQKEAFSPEVSRAHGIEVGLSWLTWDGRSRLIHAELCRGSRIAVLVFTAQPYPTQLLVQSRLMSSHTRHLISCLRVSPLSYCLQSAARVAFS